MPSCSQCGFTAEADFRFCPDCGAQQVAVAADPMLGRTLTGRYRILSRLGEGSMGAVYLAQHTALERKVAIKVLHRSLSVDEETLQRIMLTVREHGRRGLLETDRTSRSWREWRRRQKRKRSDYEKKRGRSS